MQRDNISTVGDTVENNIITVEEHSVLWMDRFSTVEVVQHSRDNHQYMWEITSVLWRSIQYCGGIASVLWGYSVHWGISSVHAKG